MFKTPKKLKKINLMGTDVHIIIDPVRLMAMGAMGAYSNNTIILLPEYEGSAAFVDTFTHECFHALNAILGTQLDLNLEEILANTMGQINVHIVNKMLISGVFDAPETPEDTE
jgi:hypothetical protein